jgi:hypothetical protein
MKENPGDGVDVFNCKAYTRKFPQTEGKKAVTVLLLAVEGDITPLAKEAMHVGKIVQTGSTLMLSFDHMGTEPKYRGWRLDDILEAM